MKWIKKYGFAFILIFVLIGALSYSFIYLNQNLLINTIVCLLFSVPISLFWLEYNTPVLQIKTEVEKVKCGKPVKTLVDPSPPLPYECIRIAVKNMGRSAATGCKCYIITLTGKERIPWTVPNENGNRAIQTINVNDFEWLNSFAFKSGENDSIYTFTETEAKRPPTYGPIINLKLLVTSNNAKSVKAYIKIDVNNREKIVVEPVIFFLDERASLKEKIKKYLLSLFGIGIYLVGASLIALVVFHDHMDEVAIAIPTGIISGLFIIGFQNSILELE